MLFGSEESERRFLLTSYNHALKGFSAMLTETEASMLSGIIFALVSIVEIESCLRMHMHCLIAE